jgi:hypothetical protein
MVANLESPELSSDTRQIHLELTVTDRETVTELLRYAAGSAREEFSMAALKVGVLAIRQACGVVDAQSIQEECQKFVDLVGETLRAHANLISGEIGTQLLKYFDPTSGEFNQRLDRLLRRDGELEVLLGKHLNGDGCSLTTTLDKHVGPNSPLLQMLSPDQRKGILAALNEAFEVLLREHCKSIVGQFSLDDKESALSRLVGEISEKNGALRQGLAGDLETIRKEFSLDNEDGALSRLVGRVERANRTILNEFSADNELSALNKLAKLLDSTNKNISDSLSLDEEASPLSRLRREFLAGIEGINKANAEFQEHVRVSLESLKVRREEAARTTTHGLDFQAVVGEFVQNQAQRQGDVYESTEDSTGAIARCKVGDFVVTLGPESAAPDARVVVEAKEDRSYTLKGALTELQKARENRRAQVGVFVFSRESAPAGIEPLSRLGEDILVVWDAKDATTDPYLNAALSLARLIVVQERIASEMTTANIAEMDSAIATISRDLALLDEITKAANSSKTNSENIITKAATLKKRIEVQVESLKEHVEALGRAV